MNLLGTIAGSAVEVELGKTLEEEIVEEAIAGTVVAGVETRVVEGGMELVTSDAGVGRPIEEGTAVAAASRLEAW